MQKASKAPSCQQLASGRQGKTQTQTQTQKPSTQSSTPKPTHIFCRCNAQCSAHTHTCWRTSSLCGRHLGTEFSNLKRPAQLVTDQEARQELRNALTVLTDSGKDPGTRLNLQRVCELHQKLRNLQALFGNPTDTVSSTPFKAAASHRCCLYLLLSGKGPSSHQEVTTNAAAAAPPPVPACLA